MLCYGYGNCAGIQPISTYEQAKDKYEKTNHIRGRGDEVRPLGQNRRFTWYRIATRTVANQYENTEYKTYGGELYGTMCFEFYPDNQLTLRTGGWQTPTTLAFIGYALRDIGSFISESGKWYFVNRKGESILFKHELELKLDEDGEYRAVKQVQEFKHTANRKAMNALRKKYKTFTDYGKTMLSMDSKLHSLEDLENSKLGLHNTRLVPYYGWQIAKTAEDRAKFFDKLEEQRVSGDLDLLYDLAMYLGRQSGHYSYRSNEYTCQPEWFIRTFEEALKYQFRDEVFNSVPVEIGTRFNDRNKKYFAD